MHTDLTVGAILRSGVLAARDREIVYSDRKRMGYREFDDRVRRLASGLALRGVERGDVVAVLDWDTHRYLECYFAVPMMGAVLQTVNLRMAPEQIVFCLAAARASVLLVNGDFLPLIADARPTLPHVRQVVTIEQAAGAEGAHYEALLADAQDFAFPELPEDSLATTFHTTGTTGAPKQVSFTHRQIVLHTLMLAGLLANQPDGQGFRRGDTYMPLTPLFHVHAWGMPYLATMLGAKQVYPGRYEPEMLLRLHRDEKVTFSHCVPAILRMLLDAAKADPGRPIGRWTVIVGGSALSSSLQGEAQRAGVTTVVGFGMSETGPVVALSRSEDRNCPGGDTERQEVLRAIGYPVPLAQVGIMDEQMNQLAWDGEARGELVVRAPWLTTGYVGNADASTGLWRGGWLHTQDVASIDPDGLLRIRDRMKDVIKSGGEWISSQDLEELITRHVAIADAAVIGIADERWGERPLLFVVPANSDAEPLTVDQIADHLKQFVAAGMLSAFAVPRQLLVLERLPRTSVGKPDKKALRAVYAAHPSAELHPSALLHSPNENGTLG